MVLQAIAGVASAASAVGGALSAFGGDDGGGGGAGAALPILDKLASLERRAVINRERLRLNRVTALLDNQVQTGEIRAAIGAQTTGALLLLVGVLAIVFLPRVQR